MEVGRKRGISRKMQAKDPLNACARKACRAGCFFLPSPRPLAIRRRFRPMQQQQAPPASSSQARATNAEASCARSQGADYHGQTIHPPNSTTTTTTLLPPNRPSVAVYPAPLLCRLLEIHCHNPATSKLPSIPLQLCKTPQTCPTRLPLLLPPTRSLLPPNRRRKHRMRRQDRPQHRPSRRNRVTM